MIEWPVSLITEIAARRCVVFLGAGASAACEPVNDKRPPDWATLLHALNNTIADTTIKAETTSMIEEKRYLDAAEIIKRNINGAEYSRILNDSFSRPRYEPSRIHKSVHRLDCKIVITTNYDEIFDNYCRSDQGVDGYTVSKYYDTNLVSSMRTPTRLIIKAHGCITDTNKIILTKSHYFNVKKEFPNFYSVLNAIFITNTLIFIGYSLDDPDMALVLQDASIVGESHHPHYAVMSDSVNKTLAQSMKEIYNIEFLYYSSGDYVSLYDSLDLLVQSVEQTREDYSY